MESTSNDVYRLDSKQAKRMSADRFICETLGAKLLSAEPGAATAELLVKPEHMNGAGICQGGVLFSLADYAMASAFNYEDETVVSLDVSIFFCRAVSSGKIIAKARETFRSRSVALGEVTVYDEEGRIICAANGRGYILKSK